MRKTLSISVAGGLLLAWSGLAWFGEDADAKDIVAKAIKAMGGEAKLAKQKAVTWTETGRVYVMGNSMPYTVKYAMHLPNHFRMEIEGVFILVVVGDSGWTQSGDCEAKAMTDEQLAAMKNDQRAGFIATVLPLKDKAFILTMLPATKVDDRPVDGIKVTRKDYPEVKLYFDARTHLLVKREWRTKAADQQYKEMTATLYYSKYKEIDGAKIPTHLTFNRDGKPLVETTVENHKAVGKLADSVFAKP
jgi:hypothetical protein